MSGETVALDVLIPFRPADVAAPFAHLDGRFFIFGKEVTREEAREFWAANRDGLGPWELLP